MPLFDSLKTFYGAEFQGYINRKVGLLEGDLTEHYFGLSALRFEQLAESVDLIINSAASVDSREPLDKALCINTLSLNNIIAAARRPNGRTVPVLHVSTCYVIRADSYQWQHYLQDIHMPGLHCYALDKRSTSPLPLPARVEETAPIYKIA